MGTKITIIVIEGEPDRETVHGIADLLMKKLDPECPRIQEYESSNLALPGFWPADQIKSIVKKATSGLVAMVITHPDLGDPEVPPGLFEELLVVAES